MLFFSQARPARTFPCCFHTVSDYCFSQARPEHTISGYFHTLSDYFFVRHGLGTIFQAIFLNSEPTVRASQNEDGDASAHAPHDGREERACADTTGEVTEANLKRHSPGGAVTHSATLLLRRSFMRRKTEIFARQLCVRNTQQLDERAKWICGKIFIEFKRNCEYSLLIRKL